MSYSRMVVSASRRVAVVEACPSVLRVAAGVGGERGGEFLKGRDGPGRLLEMGEDGAALTVGEQG